MPTGSWTFRSFNPTYVTGDQTQQEEWGLIRAEAVLNLQVTATTLTGTMEWPGPPPGGLTLNGIVLQEREHVCFGMVGTGRPGTGTDGWDYRYEGHLTQHWTSGIDQRPAGQRSPCKDP